MTGRLGRIPGPIRAQEGTGCHCRRSIQHRRRGNAAAARKTIGAG
jgi:hypothetical protein